MKNKILLLFLFQIISVIGFAQITEKQLQDELRQEGVKLNTNELEAVQNAAQEQVQQEKKDIQQEANQILQDKTQDIKKNIVKQEQSQITEELTQKIDEKVNQGATVQEAIAESVDDKERKSDPPAVYGQGIFRNGSISLYRQSSDIKASPKYILGPEDEISVNVWGKAEFSGKLKINQDGFIKFDKMPRLYLKGMTWATAQEKIKSQFSRFYNLNAADIDIALLYSRTITVNILGEVSRPGSYIISSINTAFNALTVCDGPANNGSVRNIRLISSGKPDRVIDIYKFMKNPAMKEDFYLDENDIIHIPALGKTVVINGAVERESRYELLDGENLMQLIEYANGLKPNAFKNNIQIKRQLGEEQQILDINLNDLLKNKKDFELIKGDEISIPFMDADYFTNYIDVNGGGTKVTGRYQVIPYKTKVKDIISKVALKDDVFNYVYISRLQPNLSRLYYRVNLDELEKDTMTLRSKDIIRVYSKMKFRTDYNVSVLGAVREPGEYNFNENTKLKDVLIQAGGLKDDALSSLIYVSRLQPDSSRLYYRINLSEIDLDTTSLRGGDIVRVFSKVRFKTKFEIPIFGAVREPGRYSYNDNMTLRDILFLAGGLKKEAEPKRIEISRLKTFNSDTKQERVIVTSIDLSTDIDSLFYKKVEEIPLQEFDQVFVRSIEDFELQQNIEIKGEVRYPGQYAIKTKTETIRDLIQRTGGLSEGAFLKGARLIREADSLGYMLLDLDDVMKNPKSVYNYTLKEGDKIVVPKIKDYVTMMGLVDYPGIDKLGKISAPFIKGKNARYYVDNFAGGIADSTSYRFMKVQYPNGSIKKTKSSFFGLIKKYPKIEEGSVITVYDRPRKKFKPGQNDPNKTDWGERLSKTIAQATGILTFIVLIQRIF